ncbi:MAG: hypothetical protein AMXMBFR64_28690 [Myxococcales bacterium]
MVRSLLLALALLSAACAPSTFPGTAIEDTEENREVWELLQRYRRSIEERDVVDLRKMISRDYFENAATTDDTTDDYGYEKLMADVLPILKDNIKRVKVELRVTDIKVGDTKGYATFEYIARFLYTEGGKEGWVASNDFNRLELVREDGVWKIAAGL